jgi:hypothetical protein
VSPDQIRVAVAELEGWSIEEMPGSLFPFRIVNSNGRHGNARWRTAGGAWSVVDPYTTSHDAIIPAVNRWCGEDVGRRAAFMNALHDIAGKRPGTPMNSGGKPVVSDYHKATGPALEWATALVKAAGKWVAT